MTGLRTGFGLGLMLLLAACGAEQQLTPKKGATLPVKPATSPTRPDSDQLLVAPQTVKPSRSDELLIRSQPRNDDRFDLPPH
ncbi:hypothetical protein [Sphingomonas sp. MMS24-J13]|uniref:hypothetical protein n=1 Tax=Sphingomonas sp. MMS24-J13 TaxID=3238686 RepID=UPI00384E0FA2